MNSSVCAADQNIENEKHNCSPSPQTFTSLKLTLKAWPVIALATIGLCFLTGQVAKLFGVELPNQNQVEVVRAVLLRTFASGEDFSRSARILLDILIVAPVCEELIFRGLLFKLPLKIVRQWSGGLIPVALVAGLSAALFSAAHYPDYPTLIQSGVFRWLPLSDAFLALGAFALAQCWLYRRTNAIWSPMLNHLLFNTTNLALLLLLPAK